MADAPRSDRAVLSRNYSELLVELSIALHKFSMYPGGHPALVPAAQAVVTRAEHLLVDRSQVAFGVARRQLVIEGIATNAAQPVLRRLAEGLHRHHLGAVTLLPGLDADELADVLRVLSREPEQSGPIGLSRSGARLTWPHLRLHPLSFDGLTLASDAPITGTAGAGGGLRGAELWIGLARAAMGGERAEPVADAAELEPAVVARAIDARAGAAAYDQVIVGYLLQISRELRGGGADLVALRRRTARLIGALSPETLRRLVEMGGDAAQRRTFVLDASQGMAVDAVIDIVKAAAEASGQTISHGLVRMLSKLAAHAEFGESGARPLADAALREQVGQLLSGWSLADPNPTAYTAVLQHVAITTAERTPEGPGTVESAPLDPLRLVQMSLEIGESGPMIDRAITEVLSGGRAEELLDALDQAPEPGRAAAARMQFHLVSADALHAMLEGPVAHFEALDRLEPLMTAASYAVLLDVLVASENRTVRRRLLDRLTRAPIDLGPLIVERLHDPRWFVQRNMLVLLERLGHVPDGLSLTPWTGHPDLRVRHEAIRLQLSLPAERQAAVRAALDDGHPRLVHQGLVAVQQHCPAGLADQVAAVALDAAKAEEIRVLAVRALSRCPDRRALTPLLALASSGRTWLGRARLAPRSPLMLAAVAALATGWRSDPRALGLLRIAAESSDAEVRRAAAEAPQ